MPRILLIAVTFALALSVAGCERTQPVYNVHNEPVAAGTAVGLTADQVRDAIIKAAKDKGWIARPVSEGLIDAKIFVRDHVAEVDIAYSATQYSITYKSSENLLYDGTMIHRNYNKWIKLLEARINEELAYAS